MAKCLEANKNALFKDMVSINLHKIKTFPKSGMQMVWN